METILGKRKCDVIDLTCDLNDTDLHGPDANQNPFFTPDAKLLDRARSILSSWDATPHCTIEARAEKGSAMNPDPPLVNAARMGDKPLVLALLLLGVEIDQCNYWCESQVSYYGDYTKTWNWKCDSALTAACRRGDIDLVDTLLVVGADPNHSSCLVDDVHHSPVEAARAACHEDCARLVEKRLFAIAFAACHRFDGGNQYTFAQLGRLYLAGTGVSEDHAEAARWLCRALNTQIADSHSVCMDSANLTAVRALAAEGVREAVSALPSFERHHAEIEAAEAVRMEVLKVDAEREMVKQVVADLIRTKEEEKEDRDFAKIRQAEVLRCQDVGEQAYSYSGGCEDTKCKRQDYCFYRHSRRGIHYETPDLPPRCRWFDQGGCRHGDLCRFNHLPSKYEQCADRCAFKRDYPDISAKPVNTPDANEVVESDDEDDRNERECASSTFEGDVDAVYADDSCDAGLTNINRQNKYRLVPVAKLVIALSDTSDEEDDVFGVEEDDDEESDENADEITDVACDGAWI